MDSTLNIGEKFKFVIFAGIPAFTADLHVSLLKTLCLKK